MSKEPNRNVYVGHRYVPKIMGEWDKQNDYEGLSIVTHQGASYTSKQRVPVGIDILNEEFWVLTGNYDAQIEYYRDEVGQVQEEIRDTKTDLEGQMNGTITYVDNEVSKSKNYVDDEVTKSINYVDNSIDKVKTSFDEIVINVNDFINTSDGVVSDLTGFKNALEYLKVKGGGVLIAPNESYTLDINSENDTLKPGSNTTILSGHGTTLHFGKNQKPHFFMFLLKNVDNVTIQGFRNRWDGDFSDTTTDIVSKYGSSGEEHVFASFIGLYNATNCNFKDLNYYGKTDDNIYDAVFVALNSANTGNRFENIKLSHYCALYLNDIRDSVFTGIYGTKRSNLSNSVYGPSHLFYCGSNGGIIENVYETGDVIAVNGIQGFGATLQLVSPKNTKVQNIHTNMRHVGVLYITEANNIPVENCIFDNITCDCERWLEGMNYQNHYLIGANNGLRGKNNMYSNIILNLRNINTKGFKAIASYETYRNIKIISDTDISKTHPLFELINNNHSDIELNLVNSGSGDVPFVYFSQSSNNKIKINPKGTHHFKFGEDSSGISRGLAMYNDIIITSHNNMTLNDFRDMHDEEKRNNYISKENTFNYSHQYNDTGKTVISTDMQIPRNGVYMVTVYASDTTKSNSIVQSYMVASNNQAINFDTVTPMHTEMVKGDPATLEVTIDQFGLLNVVADRSAYGGMGIIDINAIQMIKL